MKVMKKLLGLIFGIFLISFVSAQYFGPNFGYGYFDSSIITWGAVFIIIFAVVNFSLSRTVFRESKTTTAVIALAVSTLAVYGLAGRGIDPTDIYLGTEFGDFLSVVVPFVFIFGALYFLYRYRHSLSNIFMVMGLLFILVSFTNLIYEQNFLMILGIILFALGLLLKLRRPRISGYGGERNEYYYEDKIHKRDIKEQRRQEKIAGRERWKQEQRVKERARNIARIREEKERREQGKKAAKVKGRTERELRKKYSKYSVKILAIMHRNNRRIPARNTPDGHLYHRYIQAMRAIENIARSKGIRL